MRWLRCGPRGFPGRNNSRNVYTLADEEALLPVSS